MVINPSVPGWVSKYYVIQATSDWSWTQDEVLYYEHLRKMGFIYGHVVEVPIKSSQMVGMLPSEVSKISLLEALFGAFLMETNTLDWNTFCVLLQGFYQSIIPERFFGLKFRLFAESPELLIESYMEKRIQTNLDLMRQHFSHVVSNALLFLDVLGFIQYLKEGATDAKQIRKREEDVMHLVSLTLRTKKNKSAYDGLLIALFEASVRHGKWHEKTDLDLDDLKTNRLESYLEKMYFLDLAIMTTWSDAQLDAEEFLFLKKLANRLSLSESSLVLGIESMSGFVAMYKDEIPFMNVSSPVKHFYDQTTQMVKTLVQRNKKRFLKELFQSKELMRLLGQSTVRELDYSERKKLQKQLLDICKSIPSLAIFLVPGGSLLLPLLVKLLPELLPSSFNENKDKE